jgi:hypothetical protein
MSHPHPQRAPVSTRHAFALAFDLAFRRDPVHSLIVPMLLRAPWAVVVALNPAIDPDSGELVSGRLLLLATLMALGDFLTLLVVSAMLRIRARSVYNTAADARPLPAGECYARGLRRIPWLVVTEVVRNFCLGLAATFAVIPARLVSLTLDTFLRDLGRNLTLLVISACLVLPVLLLGSRVAVATECVVLDEHDLGGAFVRSWKLMAGRVERWLELIAGSAVLVLAVALLCAAFTLVLPDLTGAAGVTLLWLLIIFVMPVIQYAWTFFYLRLIEVEHVGLPARPASPADVATGTGGERAAPSLRLVPPPGDETPPRPG